MNALKYPPRGCADRLLEAMSKANMGATKLSRLTGISKSAIHFYMRSESTMSVTACIKICAALHVTPNWLLLGRE